MKGNSVLVSAAENCEEPQWIAKIEPFVLNVLALRKIENWDLSVLFCRDPFIAELNKQYRNVDAPTDVLSFEQGDEYIDDDGDVRFSAGDIVISLDMLEKNAADFSVPQDEELKRLLIHGILHLSGMDHTAVLNDDAAYEANPACGGDRDRDEMLSLQETILRSFADENIIA
ncbi:MAG: rRNA maturation RNase YbeY [Bacteroides sp.]|nr:rRNA maturation RNase YbeY [Prevotella sp.]MCM1407417.1 rRNA maturation RNase YbeY [Treponema brennaborense]MCM1469907.1 rRNA maturation RNase YbeY [Bacteroides sp.]